MSHGWFFLAVDSRTPAATAVAAAARTGRSGQGSARGAHQGNDPPASWRAGLVTTGERGVLLAPAASQGLASKLGE